MMAEESPKTPTEGQVTEPQGGEQPSPKMTPEQAMEKLSKGEIDTSKVSLDDLMSQVTDKPAEEPPKEPPAEPKPGLRQPPADKPPEEPKAKPAEERPRYNTIGEFLKTAKEELGEDYADLHDVLEKTKNKKEHLKVLDNAIKKWKTDATQSRTQNEQLQAEVKSFKDKLKAIERKNQELAGKIPPPKPSEPAIDEPEISKPDDMADQAEWNAYNQKLIERANRINEKKLKAYQENMNKQFEDERNAWQKRLSDEKQRLQNQNTLQRQRDAQTRAVEEAVGAAQDFVTRRKEFDFGDNKSVKQKNEEYGEFAASCDYIRQRDARFSNRNLVSDYLNGVPDAVEVVTSYGLQPPAGAKQFALLVELEQIARSHNLIKNPEKDAAGEVIPGTGRPDFDQAYALKKQRDGADVDDINQALARGAESTLEVVTDRQAAPRGINASDTVVDSQTKKTPELAQQEIAQIQSKLSTMTLEERGKAMKRLDELMKEIGLQPTVTQT
jgi:hypothetical protein